MAIVAPTKSKKLKTTTAAKPPAQTLGQTSHAGPGPGTPIVQPKPVSQPAQGADVYNQSMSSNIAADIDRRSAAATGGFAGSIGGMDLSGQFGSRGTTPSTAQTFATAAQSGAGSGGFVNIGAPQRTVAPGAAPTSPLLSRIDQPNGTPGQAPSKVEQAVDQGAAALGPAPKVDMGLADRRLGEYQEALGMSREVIDRLLNGPSTAERLGSQVLRGQLALARSAAGGPGAVAGAFRNAQNAAPELQAQATEQARQEEMTKLTAAGNVASNFAQAALGARGQDVNIAGKNVDAGLSVKQMVTQLAGVQLELDQRNTEMIGQMARDLAAQQFDWASLSAQQASAALDRYLQIYGIDANYRAQIKAIEAAGKITSKDILNGIIGVVGSGAAVGAAAAGKPG